MQGPTQDNPYESPHASIAKAKTWSRLERCGVVCLAGAFVGFVLTILMGWMAVNSVTILTEPKPTELAQRMKMVTTVAFAVMPITLIGLSLLVAGRANRLNRRWRGAARF